MGVEASHELPEPFRPIQKWSRHKLNSVIRRWIESNEDFGLDSFAVMNSLGVSEAYATGIIKHMNRDHPQTRVNAVTLFVTLISLVSDEFVNKADYVAEIFSLFDLGGKESITKEVLNVLLTSVGTSYAALLGRKENPSKETIRQLTDQICDSTGKKKAVSKITMEDLIQWADDNLFCKDIRSINNILQTILDTPVDPTEESSD